MAFALFVKLQSSEKIAASPPRFSLYGDSSAEIFDEDSTVLKFNRGKLRCRSCDEPSRGLIEGFLKCEWVSRHLVSFLSNEP